MRIPWFQRSVFVALLLFGSSLVLPAQQQQQQSFPGQNTGNSSPSLNLGAFGRNTSQTVVRDRHLQGTVLAATGHILPGAIVFLKNMQTAQTESVIADAQGGYRFGDLNKNGNYQLWAQTGKEKTRVMTISQYDTRDELTVNLNIQ